MTRFDTNSRKGICVRIFPFIFFIIIFSVMAYAYENVGEEGYANDDGFWNSNKAVNRYTHSLTKGRFLPLWTDINNDSIDEVFVISGSSVLLYIGNQLTYHSSYATGCTVDNAWSNPIIYDIDQNGKKEFIVKCDKKILILNVTYPAMALNLVSSISTSTMYVNQSILGCGSNLPQCYLVGFRYPVGTYTTQNYIQFTGFNKTTLGYIGGIEASGANSRRYDAPRIKSMPCKDGKCYFTAFERTETGTYQLNAYRMNQSKISNVVVIDVEKKSSDWGESFSSTTYDGFDKMITSPTLFTARDGTTKVIIGYNVDIDEYRMGQFDSNLLLVDTYPKGLLNIDADGDGQILSNPFTGTFFSNGNTDDSFCMLAYIRNAKEMTMVCGSDYTGYSFSGYEFVYDMSGESYNLTMANFSFITHKSQQQDNITVNGGYSMNLDEISTSYGIFANDIDDFYDTDLGGQFRYTLKKVYDNPIDSESVMMTADTERDGHAEIFILTNSMLYSIDDKFQNSYGYIRGDIETNPCFADSGQRVKINTSGSVLFSVDDFDNNTVCADVILYKGQTYQQNLSSYCNAHGSTFSFNWVFNRTVTNNIIQLRGWDDINPNIKNTYNISVTVATNGVEFDSCRSTIAGVGEVSTSTTGNYTYPTDDSDTTNALKDSMQNMYDLTGLSSNIVWLMIMLIVSGASVVAVGKYSLIQDARVLGAVFFVSMGIMLIIGSMAGFISMGVTISVILLVGVTFGIMLWKAITGGNSSGG